uniref:DNA mismatch repair proteins mutS family domain-containing protein n=1 Tax=viral metagenome TaxID=1070528 RepID=A0A6C0LEA8_9ZZZZ
MHLSNLEKINEHFRFPISYNHKKTELRKHIIDDLELVETVDPSGCSMYQMAFQPSTCLGKKVLEELPNFYTTDIVFLKETQQILKQYKEVDCDVDFSNMMDIWDEIKNDTGFKEKYQYIDWPAWEYLNKSEWFLQIMSLYNLTSPILSFIVPIVILFIPFFIIKAKGLPITFSEYLDVLKIVASNHAIGKLFTQFSSVKTEEKVYLIVSAGFYIFSIYQNILTCFRFHQNMIKIHSHLKYIQRYIEYTEKNMYNFLSFSENMNSYSEFNQSLREKMIRLVRLKEHLQSISPYSLHVKKIGELGTVLKHFYDIYQDSVYHDTLMYSFGFNGYTDTIQGLKKNIDDGFLRCCKFSLKKRKHIFKKAYYPALMRTSPVKNDIQFNKNISLTGPNASGKTTILKSALINIIISQQIGYGFYESATMRPFDFIHCYLNIPDTSGRDSLFQAEARRCMEILDMIKEEEHAGKTHFCAFDELYSGTNPADAVMSSLAFMEFLIKNKCVSCILTTHFIEVCKRLNANNSITNFHMKTTSTNGERNFCYTYQLKKGISELRGGLKILNDMNYPKEILDKTQELKI